MARRKKLNVEVLPAIVRPSVPVAVGSAIEQLVQQKVAEALGQKAGLPWEPYFRTRQETIALRRLQTVPERKKWSVYFDRHGCLYCHKSNQPFAGCGLCVTCYHKVSRQLRAILKELQEDAV